MSNQNPKTNEKVLGIDLGTTNSAAAIYEGGHATVIPSAEGPTMAGKMFPSVVAFTKDGQLLVGEPAKRQATTNPEGTVFEIKRKMGSDYKVTIYGKEYTSPADLSVHTAENQERRRNLPWRHHKQSSHHCPSTLQRQPTPSNQRRRRNRRLPSHANHQRTHRCMPRIRHRQGSAGNENSCLQLRRRNPRCNRHGFRQRSLPSA